MKLIKCFLYFISIYPALSIVPRKDFHEKINPNSDLSTNQLFLPFRKNKLDNSVLQSSIISQYLDKNSLDADDMIILARILNHSYYYGDWKTLDNNRVPEFSNQNGHTFMYYDSMAKYTVDLHLYDGDYVDNKVLTIMYNYKDESYFYKKENA